MVKSKGMRRDVNENNEIYRYMVQGVRSSCIPSMLAGARRGWSIIFVLIDNLNAKPSRMENNDNFLTEMYGSLLYFQKVYRIKTKSNVNMLAFKYLLCRSNKGLLINNLFPA